MIPTDTPITIASLRDLHGMDARVMSAVLEAYTRGSKGPCTRCERPLRAVIHDGNNGGPKRTVYGKASYATPMLNRTCDACAPIAIVLQRIRDAWPSMVGDEVANHSFPIDLAGNALVIVTATSNWSHQLSFLEREIIPQANALRNREISDPPTTLVEDHVPVIARLRFRISPPATPAA